MRPANWVLCFHSAAERIVTLGLFLSILSLQASLFSVVFMNLVSLLIFGAGGLAPWEGTAAAFF